MPQRQISIENKYIGNAIGYCHSDLHPGALNHDLAYKHKCVAKKCPALEKYNDEQWKLKDKFYNKSGKNKRVREKR